MRGKKEGGKVWLDSCKAVGGGFCMMVLEKARW